MYDIMKNYQDELEIIANDLLEQAVGDGFKPNYTNRDFMNAVIIFQTALMDKMYDNQDYDKMDFDDRLNMATSCGQELRKLIHTYTAFTEHKVEEFL